MENNVVLSFKLRDLGAAGKYAEQGEAFLEGTGSTLEIKEAVPQKPAPWIKGEKAQSINYACTLKNARGTYAFDFWGSIRDAEMVAMAEDVKARGHHDTPQFFAVAEFVKDRNGASVPSRNLSGLPEKVREAVKPNAYAILAALQPMSEDNFSDFCASMGYDEDSRTAEKIYHACVEQDRMIRRLYSMDEIEALSEIQ